MRACKSNLRVPGEGWASYLGQEGQAASKTRWKDKKGQRDEHDEYVEEDPRQNRHQHGRKSMGFLVA